MSLFSMVLLEEGVEVEIPGELSDVITLLDQEVPYFSCDSHMYQLTPTRIEMGKRWEVLIKAVNQRQRGQAPFPVGRIEVENQIDDGVVFRIPPRESEPPPEALEFDPVGRFYGSFAFQMLNLFQRREIIHLPGVLPTV